MHPHKEAAVAALARNQLGLVTREQLTDAGLARSTITRRVAAGTFVQVGARTFRLATAPLDPRTETLAACLDRLAVASHLSAGWLHGLVPRPALIDVTVAKGRPTQVRRPGQVLLRVHSSTTLPAGDVVLLGPVPATSLARTLLGLAALVPHDLSFDQLVDVVASAIESEQASMAWLRWMLEQRRCRGRNGIAALEAALDARDRMGPTESWLERRFLHVVDEAGLPRPRLQRRIARTQGGPARVDFVDEEARVVIEVLGYAFHRTPEQMAADTMRANDLQVQGYLVLQVTHRTLVSDPGSVVALVAAARAGRAA